MENIEIKTELLRIFKNIENSEKVINSYNYCNDWKHLGPGGYMYCEDNNYVYLEVEMRGKKNEKKFNNKNEFLEYVEKILIWQIADFYKSKNKKEDSRKIWFEKQLEIASKISPKIYEAIKKEIEEILEKFPYKLKKIKY